MGELRKTNYGAWVYDDGTLNENEKALLYIKESAESVGIEIIPDKTAFDIPFMAEVMRRLRNGKERISMNYKSFNLGDWIGHISGVIEDESELDGNEMRDLVEFLSKLQKWIPVSERLPKAFEFVNCTCHSLIDDREDWVVETVYIPQLPDSPYSDWGNIPMLNCGDCEVVAWMYRDIPKPYKAESEE